MFRIDAETLAAYLTRYQPSAGRATLNAIPESGERRPREGADRGGEKSIDMGENRGVLRDARWSRLVARWPPQGLLATPACEFGEVLHNVFDGQT
jgi:hypothetical protein